MSERHVGHAGDGGGSGGGCFRRCVIVVCVGTTGLRTTDAEATTTKRREHESNTTQYTTSSASYATVYDRSLFKTWPRDVCLHWPAIRPAEILQWHDFGDMESSQSGGMAKFVGR